MRERVRSLRDRLGFSELAIGYIVVLAFVIGGVIGGTPVTILAACGGFGECRNDEYIALNPAAGLLLAAGVALALTVLDLVMRRRQR